MRRALAVLGALLFLSLSALVVLAVSRPTAEWSDLIDAAMALSAIVVLAWALAVYRHTRTSGPAALRSTVRTPVRLVVVVYAWGGLFMSLSVYLAFATEYAVAADWDPARIRLARALTATESSMVAVAILAAAAPFLHPRWRSRRAKIASVLSATASLAFLAKVTFQRVVWLRWAGPPLAVALIVIALTLAAAEGVELLRSWLTELPRNPPPDCPDATAPPSIS